MQEDLQQERDKSKNRASLNPKLDDSKAGKNQMSLAQLDSLKREILTQSHGPNRAALNSGSNNSRATSNSKPVRFTSVRASSDLESGDLLQFLLAKIASLEMRLETQSNSFERIQNLVYDKVPSFERRITQLQNQIQVLLD